MKPIHPILAGLLMALPAAAQTGGDAPARPDSLTDSQKAGIVALAEQLGAQKAAIDRLEAGIKEKNDTIALLQQELEALRAGAKREQQEGEALAAARDSVQSLGRELYESRRQLKAMADSLQSLSGLQAAVRRLDTLMYKQCLLYPLERPYEEGFVREALTTLDRLQIKQRGLFQNEYATYAPLLRDYKKHTADVAKLLQGVAKRFDRLGYKVKPDIVRTVQNLLKASAYYPLYQQRNRPPYRSIPYLDGVVDDLLAMLDGKAPLTREYFGRLMERVGLTPEQTAQ